MRKACLRLLGPVDVVGVDDLPVVLGGPKERLVLAVLAVHAGDVVSEDRLIDAVWGEHPPRTATKTLQSYVSRLRKTLSSCDGLRIESVSSGYALRHDADAIDVTRLDRLLREARRSSAAGDHDRAARALLEAERLWRGPVLGELAGEPFALAEAARLEELRTIVIEERIEAELVAGRHSAVVAELESLTARYPLRERLWKARMLALYRCGRQADALEVFHHLREHLAEQLGLDPSPEVAALERAILVQSPDLEPPHTEQRVPAQTLPSGVVTFLLTDIERSTALWEQDAEGMDRALRAHDAMLASVVEANRGVLLKSRGEGDSTFSVFWRASDAAAAALAAQVELERLALPVVVRVRMSIHTGEAFERDGDYYGPAVNRAARLRDVAGGSEIVVSGSTAELLADHAGGAWELVSLGERRLRDLARPESVCALVPAGARPARADRERAAGTAPPLPATVARDDAFVARRAELDRLSTLWEQTKAGERRAVFLSGEPGIGKSALAAALARLAHAEGAVVLWGRCDEGLGVPHQAFAQAVHALVASGYVDVTRVAGAGELARLVPELPSLAPVAAPSASADPDAARWRLFEAVSALFAATAQRAPVVLVLDDLHWAEKPTLLLLRHLLRAEVPVRLLVLGTYRDTELARIHPLADLLAELRRDDQVDRLSLGAFDADDVAALMEVSAGHDLDARARELAAVLQRQTGGNPFFCREVLRHLAESGAIYEEGGRWTSDLDVADLVLPEGIREVIGRRLSRMSPDANDTLRVAAVIGQSFTLTILEAALDVAGDRVLDALDDAVRSALVKETPEGYEFAHALVRQTLLRELTATRTTRLHRRIGEALEAMNDGDRHLEALARHFLEAAVDGQQVKAARYALVAARRALGRAAYEEAQQWASRGIEALEGRPEPDDELRCDLLMAFSTGDVMTATGGPGPGRAAALEAAACARRAGDPDRFAAAALLLRKQNGGLGDVDTDCEAVLEEAMRHPPPGDDRIHALLLAAVAAYRIGSKSDRPNGLRYSEQALAIARRVGDPDTLVGALTARCAALESCAGAHDGLALAEELASLQAEGPEEDRLRLLMVASHRFEAGDRDGYEACVRDLAGLAAGLPSARRLLVYEHLWRATLHLLDGKWSEVDHLEAPIENPAATLVGSISAMAFLSAREQGRGGELLAALRSGSEANPHVPAFEPALALQAADAGDAHAARALLERWSREDFTGLPDDVARGLGLALCAEAAVRVRDARAGLVLQRHLREFGGRLIAVRGLLPFGAADRFLGMLAMLSHDFDEAELRFATALSLEEDRLRSRVLATRTRLWFGRMLAEMGDETRAASMLGRAMEDADDLGMAGVAVESRQLIEGLHCARRPAPADR